MRVLIIFLIVFNLFIYFWFQYHKKNDVSNNRQFTATKKTDYRELVIKSEIAPDVLALYDQRQEYPNAELAHKDKLEANYEEQGQAINKFSNGSCWLLGPYEEIVTARSHTNLLKNADIDATIVERVNELHPLFWVYLGPYGTEGEALQILNKLQVKGIDSYLVSTGEFQNAISLGVYSVESSADAVLERHVKMDLPAKKLLRPRQEKSIWLALDSINLNKIPSDLFKTLKNENLLIKKQEKDCQGVALLPIIL